MIISINQPCYLPWLGYFDRIARSDLHVVLDTVQFEKNSFTNRNKLRTAQGWTWLTVPVQTAGRFGDLPIATLATADQPDWRRKHWDTLRFAYAKAPFFKQYADFHQQLYAAPQPLLAPLLRQMTRFMLDALGIRTPLVFASDLPVGGYKADLVLNLCRHLGASRYISGPLGRNYLQRAPFDEAGIAVAFHDYRHPRYSQVQGGFEPYMGALDLLLNHGPRSLEILGEGQDLSDDWQGS